MRVVTLAGSHLGASLRERFHRADAHVRFLAVLGPSHVLGYKSQQRTLSAAVRLFCRQLNLYDITFGHFIFF